MIFLELIRGCCENLFESGGTTVAVLGCERGGG